MSLYLSGPHLRIFVFDERTGVEVALIVDWIPVAAEVLRGEAVEVVEVVIVGGKCIIYGGQEGYVDRDKLCILSLDVDCSQVLRIFGYEDVLFGELEIDARHGHQKYHQKQEQ